MKKPFLLALTLIMVLSLSSCTDNPPSNSDTNNTYPESSENSTSNEINNNNNNNNAPSGSVDNEEKTKLTGTITTSSYFSDGLALVNVNSDKSKVYCINKDGYVFFELEKKLGTNIDITEKFVNGYAIIDGGICDTTGKIVYPEEVGVTKFYGFALNNGYIVVEKITSSFDSSKKEIGVMDTDFNWIMNLSEDTYSAVSDKLWTLEAVNTKSYCFGNYLYFDGCKKYVNINTGAVTENTPESLKDLSLVYENRRYENHDGNIIIDLSQYNTLIHGTDFINGKAALHFCNQDTLKHYFTFIDKTGKFAFEPVEIDFESVSMLYFDGDYLVIQDQTYGKEINIVCYNLKGELVGEINTSSLGDMNHFRINITEGVISILGIGSHSNKVFYFNPDFTPLF